VGRGRDGLGARIGIEGVCGDRIEVWIAVGFCVRACKGTLIPSYPKPSLGPCCAGYWLMNVKNDRRHPSS